MRHDLANDQKELGQHFAEHTTLAMHYWANTL